MLYLESFGNPREIQPDRPARRTQQTGHRGQERTQPGGTRAASSHTAALASSDQAVDALFHQTGVVRVETIEELFDVGEILAHQPVPDRTARHDRGERRRPRCPGGRRMYQPRLGGPRTLRRAPKSVLANLLPPGASVRNPIDLAASATAEGFTEALDPCLPATRSTRSS